MHPFGPQRLRVRLPTEGPPNNIVIITMAPPPVSDMASIFVQIGGHTEVNAQGCHITNYVPAANGYVQVRWRGVKYYCHLLAAVMQMQRHPMPGEEASHLCGDKRCVRPSHMTLESGALNKTRSYCAYFREDPNLVCLHDPACL